MKTVSKLGLVQIPVIIRSPELNKEDNAALFPEKMEKARQIIAHAGLPPVEQVASSFSADTNQLNP